MQPTCTILEGEYLHKLCRIFPFGRFISVTPIYLFRQSLISVWIHGSYFIQWVIIQYNIIQCSNFSSSKFSQCFDHWELFLAWLLCFFYIFPSFLFCFGFIFIFEHFLTFWHYQMFWSHLFNPWISHFSKEHWFLLLEKVLETNMWHTVGVFIATGMSLLVGSLSWEQENICVHSNPHTHRCL